MSESTGRSRLLCDLVPECSTGTVVSSLDDELEKRRWTSAELAKKLDGKQQHQQKLNASATNPKTAATTAANPSIGASLPPAVGKEIQTLLQVVRTKNEQILKLKLLLKKLVGTSSLSLLVEQQYDEGKTNANHATQQQQQQQGALASWYEPLSQKPSASSSPVPPLSGAASPSTTTVITTFEQRVVELQVGLANRDRRIEALQADVDRLRWHNTNTNNNK